jgi:thiol:disulfide interchange protein DsbC
MRLFSQTSFYCMLLSAWFLIAVSGRAQENVIRQNLAERYSSLPPVISVTATPVAGIFEVRIGADIFYTDAKADHIFEGNLIDTRSKQNLTALQKNMALQVAFANLPLKNAFQHTIGNGKRQLVVFVDPNCGFCKKLEPELIQLKDVTIHYLLLPVLGEDSQLKAEHIFCAKDKTSVWLDWMLKGVLPPVAKCNAKTAIAQNLDFANQHRIGGTPTMFLENGRRLVGALPLARLNQLLSDPQAQ